MPISSHLPRPGLGNVSRRAFVLGSLLAGVRVAMGDEPKKVFSSSDRGEAEGVLKGMVSSAQNDRLDPHDNGLAVQWPKNTVVYPANVQERVSAIDADDVASFAHQVTKALAKPEIGSLFEAVATQRNGLMARTAYGDLVPQAPIVPDTKIAATGWRKEDNGKKQRYVLLITGEGNACNALREELAQWKNPKAAHEADEDLVEYFQDPSRTNLILNYRYKLMEQGWFQKTALMMKDTLTEAFALPTDAKSILIDENILADHMPQTTADTRIVVIQTPTVKQLEHLMKNWLSVQQNPNAELLVFYNGHGEVDVENPKDRRQGADEGRIFVRGDKPHQAQKVTETQLKTWLNESAAQFGHVAFMPDCCHSGAFFAQHHPAKSLNAIA